MKANQIGSPGGSEIFKLIAASNGVKKLGPKEGRTKQVGDVRLTWKATGEDTGYATSFYEMELPQGKGIPLHSHPYAEVFYIVMGHTDFLRVDEQGQEEWVRCGPGDTLVAPMNALHAFHSISSPLKRRSAARRLIAPRGNPPSPGPCRHGMDRCDGTVKVNESFQSRRL